MANDDHGHVALPKLYGAPAYARPPVVPVQQAERPFDPDELPLEAARTEEEQALARQVAAPPSGDSADPGAAPAAGKAMPILRGRAFRLRAIADRLREPRDDASG